MLLGRGPQVLSTTVHFDPRKSGTPRFLIVTDGKVVSNGFGVSKWMATMADLKKLLGD